MRKRYKKGELVKARQVYKQIENIDASYIYLYLMDNNKCLPKKLKKSMWKKYNKHIKRIYERNMYQLDKMRKSVEFNICGKTFSLHEMYNKAEFNRFPGNIIKTETYDIIPVNND